MARMWPPAREIYVALAKMSFDIVECSMMADGCLCVRRMDFSTRFVLPRLET